MTPPPLSVVHLLAPAPFGGLESVVLALAGAQQRHGDRVTVVSVLDDEEAHPFVQAVAEAGLQSRELRPGGRGYLRERREVRAILQEVDADVLHTHGYRPDVVDSPVARGVGARSISTVHGFTLQGWRGRLYEWLQRRAYRSFDAVAVVSAALRDDLVAFGVPSDRVHLVRNAWAPTQAPLDRGTARDRLGLPAEGRLVGWVGRMSAEKAPDVMVRALAESPDRELELVMVGTGPMVDDLRRLAQRVGVAGRVRWLGAVAGAGAHLAAFDALALSSWTEGTPMVLLEAISARVPVVSTAVGGVPDVVTAAEAVLVEAGDTRALGHAVAEAAAGGPGVQDRVEAAAKRIERDFALVPWVERYRILYTSAGS